MSTIAIVGAGQGLGAAVARTFGAQGFDVALISRSQERLEGLAADLAADGVHATGYAANVRDPQALTAALDRAAQELGPIEMLQYSPLPQKEFLRPVLETTAQDLVGAMEFSVYGAVAAVHQVLQGMRALGRGSVLFVNGGSGARPSARVAGTSVAFAGLSAYARMMHDVLGEEGLYVGQLIIPGAIEPGSATKDPAVLASTLWTMHTEGQRGGGAFRTFAEPLD